MHKAIKICFVLFFLLKLDITNSAGNQVAGTFVCDFKIRKLSHKLSQLPGPEIMLCKQWKETQITPCPTLLSSSSVIKTAESSSEPKDFFLLCFSSSSTERWYHCVLQPSKWVMQVQAHTLNSTGLNKRCYKHLFCFANCVNEVLSPNRWNAIRNKK